MAHVITQACCNDATCVAVCPADCIHPTQDEPDYARAEMLFIDPRHCVDCGACIPACPVDAIMPDDELSPGNRRYAELNALYFDEGPGRIDRPAARISPPRQMGLAHEAVHLADESASGELRVAIVGSGPAACYAADEILSRHPGASVTMLERLPTPWGLVRAGVAPDHLGTKEVIRLFERTAAHPRFTLHLNVEVGRDVSLGELRGHHHAVIWAGGAAGDRRLGVPGEDLPGSHSATGFVAWYNGHPDAAVVRFDLATERAVVIGNGNVALDVARMLLADIDTLRRSDIAEHALEALSHSRIEEVVVLGRRGPGQAAFATSELMALGQVGFADVLVDPAEAELDPVTAELLREAGDSTALFKASVLVGLARTWERRRRRIRLRFLRSPVALLGTDRVEALQVVRTELVAEPGSTRMEALSTGEVETLETGLVLRAVGYRGRPVPGLPFDERTATLPHRDGRVLDPATGAAVPGVFAAGWIKRGPSGGIGTNKKCAHDTVDALLADHAAGRFPEPSASVDGLSTLLAERGTDALGSEDWRALDRQERSRGVAAGRPRVKFVERGAMLDVARRARIDRPTGA